MVKSTVSVKPVISKDYHWFEHSVIRLPLESKGMMIVITVYRLQYVPVAKFIEEFGELVEKFVVLNEDCVIAGDVNIHMETNES